METTVLSLAAEGRSLDEVAKATKLKKLDIMRIAAEYVVSFKAKTRAMPSNVESRSQALDRDEDIRKMIAGGKRPKQIAMELGVTRQRIYQRLKRGGIEVPPIQRPPKMSKRYGMPMSVVRRLIENGATRAYTYQRNNAAHRGIGWQLTLAEWWGIWEASGKWELRGRHKGGWVMGRPGDIGPYAVGNVVICTHSENAKVAQSHARRKPAAAHIVTVRSKKRPYVVKMRKRYRGAFATEAEALAKKREIDMEYGLHLM